MAHSPSGPSDGIRINVTSDKSALAVIARWRRSEAIDSNQTVLPWIGWESFRPLTWQ